MKNEKNLLTSCFEDNIFTLLIFFAVMFLVFTLISPKIFLSVNNLQSIAFQFSELGILAIAMCLAVVPGGIDLSIVSSANLSAVIMAIFLKNMSVSTNMPIVILILITIAVGILVGSISGFINGLIIGYLEIPPILATLVTMTLYQGLAIGITKGTTVASIPKEFLYLGTGTFFGIPIPLIIFIFVAIVINILLMKHKFGYNIFLIGTSQKASSLTGIVIRKNIALLHTVIGIISALAGVIILARTNSASAYYGASYILSTILIVILAGVSILGGKGHFVGVVIAIVFLQVLSTGFNIVLQSVSGSNFLKDFIWGLLLILMIFMNKSDKIKLWMKSLASSAVNFFKK